MEIRKVLTLVSEGSAKDDETLLPLAFSVARRFGAHLEVFHAGVDPREAIAFAGEGMTAAMIEQVMAAAEKEGNARGEIARALYERARGSSGAGVSSSFVEKAGPEDELMAERGRLADLIVIRRPSVSDSGAAEISATVESCLRETGRPVLILPPDAASADFGRRCVIAWNGSVEGGRAVKAAIPVLKTASEVLVLTADEAAIAEASGRNNAGADLCAYLELHGIRARAERLHTGRFGVGTSLISRAMAVEADLLIMGAYTRSHMRRLIFGGVTAEVLSKTTIPVLMTH